VPPFFPRRRRDRLLILSVVLAQALLLVAGWAMMYRLLGQPAEAIRFSFLLSAFIVGLLVVIPTGLLTGLGIRRHHRVLSDVNADLEQQVQRRVSQFIQSRDALVLGLAKLADFRDNETGQHLERLCHYCELLARELGRRGHADIDDDYIDRLRLAASMHDIGKVGVPDRVLLKPGRLTDDEYDIIKQHPTIGADTLLAIRNRFDNDQLINMGVQVTLSHHERWDGLGYPYGLRGEDIPLAARIVSVADVYDALTVQRVYKPALPHGEATQIIESGRGTQFDPAVVDAYLAVQDQFSRSRDRDAA
jgi:putative two-component system response regulator